MSTEIIGRRVGLRLEASTEFFAEDLARIPEGRDVKIEIKVTPVVNLQQLKWCWALAHLVAQNHDKIHDKDDAMDLLCTLAHHVDVVVNPFNGHEYIRRRSLRLPQDEMCRLQARFVYVTMMWLLPGIKESVLREELETMVTEDRRQPRLPAPKIIEHNPEEMVA